MNTPLNIVFALRKDYQSNSGGDTIQMMAWYSSLKQLGYNVVLTYDITDDAAWKLCDIVFIWHLERVHESYPWWQEAKKRNIPIVLVPTYWHNEKRYFGFSLWKQVELVIRCLLKKCSSRMLWYSWARCRENMLTQSALLLVNSAAERDLLVKEGAAEEKILIVYNIISHNAFSNVPSSRENRKGIVCIGHFCPRKNQLKLIKALKHSPIHITFIGEARPMHKFYWKRCIKLSKCQHSFLGNLSHSKTLAILKNSECAISVSLSETPGIANLEAAAAGCNMILPALAPIKEYFPEDCVHYIDPCNIDAAMLASMVKESPKPFLSQFIKREYSENYLLNFWKNVSLENLL